jgi:hypothetical protein
MLRQFTLSLFAFAAQTTAIRVQVDQVDVLEQVKTILDALYDPVESTAGTIASFVKNTPGPIETPDRTDAGMVTGTPKGALATALWVSFNEMHTNGLWVGFSDSGILGYWNINGLSDPHPRHMYRPGGHDTSSGCPQITATAECIPSAWTGAPPTSCDAILTGCQTFHEVDALGDITAITRQRAYDAVARGWWQAHENYAPGTPYWLDLFSSPGYQATDSTVPLLIGYYQVPVVNASGATNAIVLMQLSYASVAKSLAHFDHIENSVLFVMEAANGELVATSNGEPISGASGAQKMASDAATELISLSASHINSIGHNNSEGSADATGQYRFTHAGGQVSVAVLDYKRASGTMHHKVVIASYMDASEPTPPPPLASSDGPAIAGIVLGGIFASVALASCVYYKFEKEKMARTQMTELTEVRNEMT